MNGAAMGRTTPNSHSTELCKGLRRRESGGLCSLHIHGNACAATNRMELLGWMHLDALEELIAMQVSSLESLVFE